MRKSVESNKLTSSISRPIKTRCESAHVRFMGLDSVLGNGEEKNGRRWMDGGSEIKEDGHINGCEKNEVKEYNEGWEVNDQKERNEDFRTNFERRIGVFERNGLREWGSLEGGRVQGLAASDGGRIAIQNLISDQILADTPAPSHRQLFSRVKSASCAINRRPEIYKNRKISSAALAVKTNSVSVSAFASSFSNRIVTSPYSIKLQLNGKK